MPELPEVEILVRHLRPLLQGRSIRDVAVRRPKIVRPEDPSTLKDALVGRSFEAVHRRAKYLIFELSRRESQGVDSPEVSLIGHLGMTGRMFVQPGSRPLPKHTALTLDLGADVLVFEDTRCFGRMNLDLQALHKLGPEPLDSRFTPAALRSALGRSVQPIKVKLMDQMVVAGVGNIYASEALHRAGIHPARPARRLDSAAAARLVAAVREVLTEAIQFGSTLPLSMDSADRMNGLFYFGQSATHLGSHEERLRVYDRATLPCFHCGTPIRRCVQAARSTYWCPACQRR